MTNLHELDGSRVPEAVLRSPNRRLLLPRGDIPDIGDLEFLLQGAIGISGIAATLSPLRLPFSISGTVDVHALAQAFVLPPPPPPPPAIVMACAVSWLPDDAEWNALDALWCAPGDCWLGMASGASRARALFTCEESIRAAGGYAMRSLQASLMHDLDTLCGTAGIMPCWGQAIVMEPSEIRAAVPSWPMHRWAMIVLDDKQGQARSEVGWDEQTVCRAVSGRAVWPPRAGLPIWVPTVEEERVFVNGLVDVARRKPPVPHISWGTVNDDVDW